MREMNAYCRQDFAEEQRQRELYQQEQREERTGALAEEIEDILSPALFEALFTQKLEPRLLSPGTVRHTFSSEPQSLDELKDSVWAFCLSLAENQLKSDEESLLYQVDIDEGEY